MASEEAPAPAGLRIACAVNGAPLARDCSLEARPSPQGKILLIRHSDGGFRRFLVVTDGRGVIAADGASPARVQQIAPKQIEVVVEEDRYQLPIIPMAQGPAA